MKPPVLNERITVHAPTTVDKPGGVSVEGWDDGQTIWAHVRYLRGGESVMAARLSGKSPAIFTVNKNRITDQITPEWKVVYRGQDFNVREMPRLTEDHLFYEFLAEAGVAV